MTLRGATPTATLDGGSAGTSVLGRGRSGRPRGHAHDHRRQDRAPRHEACSDANGEGIDNAGTLTLVTSSVVDNVAGYCFGIHDSGGGIFNSGTMTIEGSTVSGNFAGGRGGGDRQPRRRAVDHELDGERNGAGDHGGIANSGTLTVRFSTVSGNTLNGATGGIFTDEAAAAPRRR